MRHTKLILFGIVAMLSLTGCHTQADFDDAVESLLAKGTDTTEPEIKAESTESTERSTETETETETEAELPKINYLKVGDTAMVSNWTITLLSSEITDSVPGSSGKVNPEPGNKFLVNTFDIYNHGKQREQIISNVPNDDEVISVKVLYGNGYEFLSHDIYESDSDLHMEYLQPLTGKKGTLTHEIGSQVLDGEEDLVLKISFGEEEAYYMIRGFLPETESLPVESADEAIATAALEESESGTEMPAEAYLNIGDSAELDDWTITVRSKEIRRSVSDDYYRFDPHSGHRFLMVSVRVTNHKDESRSFLPSFLIHADDICSEVIYGDGYKYASIELRSYNLGLEGKEIGPSASKEGKIAYEIPETIAGSDEPLLLRLYVDSQSVIYKIR